MDQPALNRDSQVLLLLASRLGLSAAERGASEGGGSGGGGSGHGTAGRDASGRNASGAKDADRRGYLDAAAWAAFETRIRNSALESPGDLLQRDPSDWPADVWTDAASGEWVERRLGRSTKLAMALEDLDNRGVWVTTRYEPTYPDRLEATLGPQAPPYLYVAGVVDHLHTRAVSVLGAGHVDDVDRAAAQMLVERAVDDGFAIVSGGANSFDDTTADVAADQDGTLVECPADGLYSRLQERRVRDGVLEGDLAVVSPVHPEVSPEGAATAARDRLLHGLGEYTVVVRCEDRIGGLWDGAIESLDAGWAPLFVVQRDATPSGNRGLVERGAVPIDPGELSRRSSFENWISERVQDDTDAENVGESGPPGTDPASADGDGSNADESGGNGQSSLNRFE